MEQSGDQNSTSGTSILDGPVAPSIHDDSILSGVSYTHHSSIPEVIVNNLATECVLGIDEAGRGPVLGPMVYGLLYLPLTEHRSLLAQTHHFDDSKVLTPTVRLSLMQNLCTSGTDLYRNCGWATRVMSAKDIAAGMLRPAGTYNLNAQAMDATIQLIEDVFSMGVNVKEIYIDTIGSPQVYQKKLERIFPTTIITVAKKADSLFPCVSAASVCAKVTRDAALEVCYQAYASIDKDVVEPVEEMQGWGSGYPSDPRCTTWLKSNMDPLFGWGSECRFSWSTVKDLLEAKDTGIKLHWPCPGDGSENAMKVTDFFMAETEYTPHDGMHELTNWFSIPVKEGSL
ncbi:hypothetical protein MMC09_003436 [Bachmanniomyces sp. S44760]|nr:hypothetical protein [Bachmanniomyces sp. S44760]